MAKQNSPAQKTTSVRPNPEVSQGGVAQTRAGQRPAANLAGEELEQIQRSVQAAKWPLRKTPGELLSDSDGEVMSDSPVWPQDVIVAQAGGVEAASGIGSATGGATAAGTTTAVSAGAAATTTSVGVLTGTTTTTLGIAAGAAAAGGAGGGGGSTSVRDTSAGSGTTLDPDATASALANTITRVKIDPPGTTTPTQGNDPRRPGVLDVSGGAGRYEMEGDGCDNTLIGANGDDTLWGYAGDDKLLGGAGNDVLDGGLGSDTALYSHLTSTQRVVSDLSALVKKAVVYGPGGAVIETDTLIAVENLTGGAGNDSLTGDVGDNQFEGGAGDDTLSGLGGSDTLVAAAGGNDVVDGGTGADTLSFATTAISGFPNVVASNLATSRTESLGNLYQKSLVIDLGSSANAQGWKNYFLTTGSLGSQITSQGQYKAIENVTGTQVNDVISGDSGVNVIHGGNGNDLIYGDGNADTLLGGGDQDWALFDAVTVSRSSAYASVIADLSASIYTSAGGSGSLVGFDNLLGSQGADTLTGSANNILAFKNAFVHADRQADLAFRLNSENFQIQIPQLTDGSDAAALIALQAQLDGLFDIRGNSLSGSLQVSVSGADLILTTTAANSTLNLGALMVYDHCENGIGLILEGQSTSANNILAGGDGNDILAGLAGNDLLLGGASNAAGNVVTGGVGSDVFYAGYNHNPVSDPLFQMQGMSAVSGTDIIMDWDADVAGDTTVGRDALSVSALGRAVIGGLAGLTGWAAGDVVDLRGSVAAPVSNEGEILISAAAGNNQIFGSNGRDVAYVGYNYDASTTSPALIASQTAVAAKDILWNWDDQSGGTLAQNAYLRDALYVSSAGTAIIGGLAVNANGSTWSGWSNDDLVDLRTQVTNQGLVVISAGAGNNTVYGSAGSEQIFGGSIANGYGLVASTGGNQNWGGGGADTFLVGYNYNPAIDAFAVPTKDTASTAASADIIWDWDDQGGDSDFLYVSATGVAIIGGLAGKTDPLTLKGVWSGNDQVDLRGSDVVNLGTIVVATSTGYDTVYGSAGVDVIYTAGAMTDGTGSDVGTLAGNQVTAGSGSDTHYVGFEYDPVFDLYAPNSDGRTATSGLTVVMDWDDDASAGSLTGRDGMVVSTLGRAVIGGLAGVAGWIGNDTIDLRGNGAAPVTNQGEIWVAAGVGQNQIYGSNGRDLVYVGRDYDPIVDSPLALGVQTPVAATDILWNWDDQPSGTLAQKAFQRDALYVTSTATAIIGGLAAYANGATWTDWSGNDVVDLRAQVSNSGLVVISSGAGSNVVYGSSGVDKIFGASNTSNGYGAVVDTGGNQNWGGDGADNFQVGYTYNPSTQLFAVPVNGAGTAIASADIIWDWDDQSANRDTLYVSSQGVAIIGGLAGKIDATSLLGVWSGNDLVDLRGAQVQNSGKIVVATSVGYDTVYGSTGVDVIHTAGAEYDVRDIANKSGNQVTSGDGSDTLYVGYEYSPLLDLFTSNSDGRSVTTGMTYIRDWDDQNAGTLGQGTLGRDSLYVSAYGTAVIGGLAGVANWSGNNTVDLRGGSGTVVDNMGKIVVSTGAGDDTIYGSNGNDWIFAGTGRNLINLGSNAATEVDGADRVYIDNFQGEFNIVGFDRNDSIYIDRRIIDTFRAAKVIAPPTTDNVLAAVDKSVGAGVAITTGRAYDNGSFALSELTYDGTYNGLLSTYPGFDNQTDPDGSGFGRPLAYGWQSNGAWSTEVHDAIASLSKAAVITAGGVSIGIGNGLVGIPFVGPLLAIPFYVTGGLMLNDGINNVRGHQNAQYRGVVLDAGVNILASNNNAVNYTGRSAEDTNWDTPQFLSFFQIPNDRFTPTLEFTGFTQGETTKGIGNFVTVYNGTETFLYLVYSRDGMVQNNETRLMAQINGRVYADQFKIFDGATDADYLTYMAANGTSPDFPTEVSTIAMSADGGKKLMNNGQSTNDVTPTFAITLARELQAGETLQVTFKDGASTTTIANNTLVWSNVNKTATFTLAEKPAGSYSIGVSVANAQGLQSDANFDFAIDLSDKYAISASTNGSGNAVIRLTSNADGGYQLRDQSSNDLYDDGSFGTGNSYSDTSSLLAQGSVRTGYIQVTEGSVTDTLERIQFQLGTIGGDTINGSSVKENLIFGFGGADTITGGQARDQIFGGDGNDTLTAGKGGDLVSGGAGNDTFVFAAGDTALTSATISKYASPSTDEQRSDQSKFVFSGYDTILDFTLGDGVSTNYDTLNLVGVSHTTPASATMQVAANATTDGTDFAGTSADATLNITLKSHRITNGLVQFDDVDTFASPIALTANDLDEVIGYLQANLTQEGDVAAFALDAGAGADGTDGNADDFDTYVFQNNSSGDLLIQLQGVSATGLMSEAAWVASTLPLPNGYVLIV